MSEEPPREFKPGLVLGTDRRREDQLTKQASKREAKKRLGRGQDVGHFEALLNSIRDVQSLHRVLIHNKGRSAMDYYGVLFQFPETMLGIIEMLQNGSPEALDMVLCISSHPMDNWSRQLLPALPILIQWLGRGQPNPNDALGAIGNILCSCPEARTECFQSGLGDAVWVNAGVEDGIIYVAEQVAKRPVDESDTLVVVFLVRVWEQLIRHQPLYSGSIRALRSMCNSNWDFMHVIISEPAILAQLPQLLPDSLDLYDIICESPATHQHFLAYDLDHKFLALIEPGVLPLDQVNMAIVALSRLYDVEQVFVSRCPADAPTILVGAYERLRLPAIRTRLVLMLINMLRFAVNYEVKECMIAMIQANTLDVLLAVLRRDNGTPNHLVAAVLTNLEQARRFQIMNEAIHAHPNFIDALETLAMCPHPDLSTRAESFLRAMEQT